MTPRLCAARVRVPCSTSNMGAGFDTVGLALDRYVDVRFDPGGSGLSVLRGGTLAEIADDEHDIITQTFHEAILSAGADPAGRIEATSEIPLARGLGSSAAAALAGFDLARAALGLPPGPEAAFAEAYGQDGHGDNAAACVWGGLQAVVQGTDGLPRAIRLDLSEAIGFAFSAPSTGVATSVARAALPRLVTHDVASASLGRLAALLAGLARGDPELIGIGTDDELHVPFRITLIPNAHNAIAAANEAGAWAVTISGAGTGLLAFCEPGRESDVAEAMRTVFAAGLDDPSCLAYELRPDLRGMVRLDPEGDAGG